MHTLIVLIQSSKMDCNFDTKITNFCVTLTSIWHELDFMGTIVSNLSNTRKEVL